MYELSVEALIWRLSVAFAIGLLIGLERGWQARGKAEGERAAGLRTFALTALLGGVWGAIVLPFGGFAAVGLAIIFIGVCAVIAFLDFVRLSMIIPMARQPLLRSCLLFLWSHGGYWT